MKCANCLMHAMHDLEMVKVGNDCTYLDQLRQ